MNRCAAMFLLWLGGVMAAETGIIFTKDGKTWAGRIELRSGPALHITGSSGKHQVPLADVRRAVFGKDAGQAGLRDLSYELYRGTWQQLPDFTALKPTSSGPLVDNQVTLYPNDTTAGYAMVFTGKLHVPAKGVYQFFVGSDDGTRLSLDGKPVIDNDGRHGFRERQGQMDLAAGKHEFQLEYFNHSAAALLRLDWSGPGITRTPLSREGKPVVVTTKIMNPATELAIRQPGALAWNGAFIAREVIAADETKLTFGGVYEAPSLSTINTAVVFYQAVSVYRAQSLRGRKSGILATDGQFIEGKVLEIKDGEVEVQSVLFGRKKYKINSYVVAVVFSTSGRAQEVYRVRTRNGMIHVAKTVKADNASLQLNSTSIASVKLQRDEIQEIEHGILANPLNAAWQYWDGLDATARDHLKSRESTIVKQTRAIAQVVRERAVLQQRHRAAISNLAVGKEVLQLTLKSREFWETATLKDKTKIDQAQSELEKEIQAETLAKAKVAQAKALQGEMIKAVAVAKEAHEKLMAKADTDEKQALADIEEQKTNAAAQLKKSEIRLKQLEVKSMQDQLAAGNAATNRLKSLATLALEQKSLIQAQVHLDSETKAKAALEAQLATAKTASTTAQRAQQTAQGTFNGKQTAFNTAKAAVDAAVAAKRVPAVTRLSSAEKALQQTKLAAGMADKKLADDTSTMAALTQEKIQLDKALADLGKAHDEKQKLVTKAQMNRAKAEAQAMIKNQKATASRTALVNLVVGKQDSALAAYKNATNMVAEAQVAKVKAGEMLRNIQAEVAGASKASKAAEAAAQAAEIEFQTVKNDAKKSSDEKAAAKKKSAASGKLASTAKAFLVKLETEKLKPALAQVAITAKVLAKAMADQAKTAKVLDGLAVEIQRATVMFNRDDQAARTETAKAQESAKLHEILMIDLAFIAKQRDKAAKAAAAAVMVLSNFDQQQMKPAHALTLKNKQAVTNAEKVKITANQEMVVADAEIKRLTQVRQNTEANLVAAKTVLDKTEAVTRQAQALQMNLEEQLAVRQKSFVSASTEIATREKAVNQADSASKQVEKDELVKLKPAAESKAMLNLESLLHQELERQLVKELKDFEAALQELRTLHKNDLTAAIAANQEAQKLQAEQEKRYAEAMEKLNTAAAEVQVAASGLKRAKFDYDNHLKALAEYSKAVQNTRGNINVLQSQRAASESALHKFLFANRALLNLN